MPHPRVTRRGLPPVKGRAPAADRPHIALADRRRRRMTEAVLTLFDTTRARFEANMTADGMVVTTMPPEVAATWLTKAAAAAPTPDRVIENLLADLTENAAATVTTSFRQVREQSVAYAQTRTGDLIRGLNSETRRQIAGLITEGQLGDLTVDQITRRVAPLIGLTPHQTAAVARYRAALEARALTGRAGPDAALGLTGRFGLSPWRGGKLDTTRIEGHTDRYAARLRRQRAETIARTETIRAASAGEMIAWQDDIDNGGADGYTVTREWSVTRDDRACQICLRLDGTQIRVGPVTEQDRPQLDQGGMFDGAVLHPPRHPRCRCTIDTTLELAPIPDPPPAAGPPPWTHAAEKDRRAVRRAADAMESGAGYLKVSPGEINGQAVLLPGENAVKYEAAVRKLGRRADREITERTRAAGFDYDARAHTKALRARDRAVAARERRYIQVRAKHKHLKATELGAVLRRDRRYMDLTGKARAAEDTLTGHTHAALAWRTAYADQALATLREFRGFGGRLDVGGVADGTALAALDRLTGRYPTDWLNRSNTRGPVSIEHSEHRAFYRPDRHALALTATQRANLGGDSTATHELGHAMEETNPRLKAAQWAFIARRAGDDGPTAGITPRRLSDLTGVRYDAAETAYADKFTDAYMGKVYAMHPGSPFEVLTMGMEALFHPEQTARRALDDDYRAFVLGLLAGV